MERKTKMVCVMRKDLRNTDGQKLPKGKLIAQGGHAYTALILKLIRENPKSLDENPILKEWLENSFTKICLGVDSLAEIMGIYEKATLEGLNTVIITDNGYTQFGGIPTVTCIGIGPDDSDKIDRFTGYLKSL